MGKILFSSKTRYGGGAIFNGQQPNLNNDKSFVVLKILKNSCDSTFFLREIANYKLFDDDHHSQVINCYGISQDPVTKNYIMVMEYMENGNLRQYLNKNYSELDLRNKLIQLHDIAKGLKNIHSKGLVHKDFHTGNILTRETISIDCYIADLGFCRPVNESDGNKVYGVLPYIAPEVLHGQPYTQAADIYSFGIVATEMLSGLPPHYDIAHDTELQWDIVEGKRPDLDIVLAPQSLKDLIKQCWDKDPLLRPTASELERILDDWWRNTVSSYPFQEAEKFNRAFPKRISDYEIHPSAIYTSRLLPTKCLSQPRNSQRLNILENQELNSFKITQEEISTRIEQEKNNAEPIAQIQLSPKQL